MPKATRPSGEVIDFVEVRDEPQHRQQYENLHVRIYIAGVAPGCESMWHRHKEDTLYTCLRSADILNRPLDKAEYLHEAYKGETWWTLKAAPYIHQVCISKDAAQTWLLAVEVMEPPPIAADALLPSPAYTQDPKLAHAKARVNKLRLAPGESTGEHSWNFYGMVVALTDGPGLRCEGSADAPFADGSLATYGNWKWVQGPVTFSLTNDGPEPYEATVLEWLKP